MLLKKYKEIKDDYMSRSPKGKWNFVRHIGIFILKLTGTPILDYNYKIRWYSYIGYFAFFITFSSLFYTIWYYWDQPMKKFQGVSILGITIPVG